MAAQGNQSVFERPEGETTQWDDLQRKFGNLPPAKAVEKAKPFSPAQEPDKVTELIEAKDEEALEGLDDDFADDSFLEQYRLSNIRNACRQIRLQQLKAAEDRCRFGSVSKIVREEFIKEVTEASRDVWVVVHLYKDKVPASALLGSCLDTLAQKFTRTKFLKIISNDCIPNYPDRNLPTLLIYKDAQCKHNLVGVLQCGGRLSPDGVAERLNRLGPICNEEHADI